MRYLSVITFITVVICIFTSCEPYIHKHFLTEDEQKWLKCYHENETIIFYADKYNLYDTLFIEESFIKNPKSRNPFNLEGRHPVELIMIGNSINGYGNIYFTLKHNNKELNGHLELEKLSHKNPAVYELFIYGIIDWYNCSIVGHRGDIEGITLTDDSITFKVDSTITSNPTGLLYLNWKKDTGLESYMFKDSILYQRVKN